MFAFPILDRPDVTAVLQSNQVRVAEPRDQLGGLAFVGRAVDTDPTV